jgi:hypothetical protein
MLEKLLTYLRLGIQILTGAVDLLAQLLEILLSTEDSIAEYQPSAS